MNKKVILGVRIIFGLMLIVMGGMSFFSDNSQLPNYYSAEAMALIQGFAMSYLKYFMGLVFICVGIMFVTRRYVALGAIILAPIIVNIILFHIFYDMKTIGPGAVFLVLELVVAYSERKNYQSILRSR